MEHYPKQVKFINDKLAVISGGVILLIGCFSVFEVVMRGVFTAPTKWTADFNQYLLIWAIFLAAGYGFQAQGHVRVDIVTRAVKAPGQRIMAIAAYLVSLGFVGVFTYYTWKIFVRVVQTHVLTYAVIQIPRWILFLAMLVGDALMIVTVAAIVYSILRKQEYYL